MSQTPWSRYLLLVAALTIAVTGLLAGVNFFADPYGIHRLAQGGKLAFSRPAIRTHERLHKAHALAVVRPQALLLGNSRVAAGLAPSHPALPTPGYNAGLSAASIYECVRYFQHAITLHKPSIVLFAIDKRMFSGGSKNQADFTEDRLAADFGMQPNPWWRWADVPDTLLSASALAASFSMMSNSSPDRIIYERGLRDECLMKPFTITAQVLAQNKSWRTSSLGFRLYDKSGRNIHLESLRTILRLCAEKNIELVLFTSPIHAELLDVDINDGITFSQWFRQVVDIVATENTRSGRHTPFWNFYGFNAITTEPFPPPARKTCNMKNYWDNSHYRKELGDLVISRMLGQGDAGPAALPRDFGRQVTRETVSRELADLMKARDRWKKQRGSPAAGQPGKPR